MLERISALASARPYRSGSLSIAERRGFSLIQVAALDDGFEQKLMDALGAVPEKVGIATEHDGRTIMRVGPQQFWIMGPENDGIARALAGQCAVTPLSNSRTRIALDGEPARDVLSKLVFIDLHPRVFTPGTFAMTGMHHTPVTVHCTGETSFDIYAMRTFAMNVWEVITDAALEYATA
jgi:sarcosine oxidase subunit gamma